MREIQINEDVNETDKIILKFNLAPHKNQSSR